LVVANFNRYEKSMLVKIADDLLNKINVSGAATFTDLLTGNSYHTPEIREGLNIIISATNALLLAF
jgi:hypothetical protein